MNFLQWLIKKLEDFIEVVKAVTIKLSNKKHL